MTRRYKEGVLPFKIVPCNEPLVARSGLLLPYEMAKALRLPRVIDGALPGPGSGRGYKPSQFVLSLILMFHGGGKKLEDLREIKKEDVSNVISTFNFPRGFENIHIQSVIKTPVELLEGGESGQTFMDEVERGIVLWEKVASESRGSCRL